MTRDYVLRPFHPTAGLRIDYASELNPQQLAAVTAPPGPSLVIAGAGSGKTRTLTYRVAFLLEQGIPPERILLLTFTNKAAREMMRRVSDLLGQELPSLWGGTFHSVGNRVLRLHADRLGFLRNFAILDREDANDLIGVCLAEAEVDTKEGRFPKKELLGEIFSLAINTGRSIEQILGEQYSQFALLAPMIGALHNAYTERKRANNAMDFDDLLALWLKVMREHPAAGEVYQRRFQFILVDEYQDTNSLQGELIDFLAARHHNVMAVGDDAQSIYAWRGANFQNILKFPERYPGAKVYKIETNYRSTPEILEVANAAIRPNIHQFAKELSPARRPGLRPVLCTSIDAAQQAAFVAQRVLELRDEGVDLNQVAVLYRSHFHALELQLELTRQNIPFTITSGIRFFEQAHIKDVAAYLRLATNPCDELSFKRLVQLLPGVGAKGAEKLWRAFADRRSPGPAATAPPIAAALQACSSLLPRKSQVAWTQFSTTIAQLETGPQRAGDMIKLVLEAGYEDYLKDSYDNYRSRVENLNDLAVFARQFGSVEEFLTQLALLTSLESEDDGPRPGEDERLRLSTVHQAKGLEFDVVFIIMLCEGLFPSARALEIPDGEEEERRLLYVACTRARNELYLCYPLTRAGYGGGGNLSQSASRFLSDIPRELLDEWTLKHPWL